MGHDTVVCPHETAKLVGLLLLQMTNIVFSAHSFSTCAKSCIIREL